MFLRKKYGGWVRRLIFLAVTAAVVAVLPLWAGFTGDSAARQGLSIAEDGVRRAAVQCYALEGVYPPSFEYLRQHYGVNVSDELYFVGYTYQGANLMPDITVILRGVDISEVME